ncbi:MAG: hypothetical protein OEV40_31835 [Acidimicrobiia bacterium]|nr:hypothetical protein [Acidimicrobiia bacterium]
MKVKRIGLVLVAVGAGLAALGLLVGGLFVGAAVAVFGLAAIVGGVDSVATRRHRTSRDEFDSLRRVHTGAAAVIFGFTFIAVGVFLTVTGVAAALGVLGGLWSQVADSAGIVIIAVGGWACVLGVAMVISRWTYVGMSTNWWQRLPGIAVGLLVVMMGLIAVGIGRSVAVDPPQSGSEFLEKALDTLARWLGSG